MNLVAFTEEANRERRQLRSHEFRTYFTSEDRSAGRDD